MVGMNALGSALLMFVVATGYAAPIQESGSPSKARKGRTTSQKTLAVFSQNVENMSKLVRPVAARSSKSVVRIVRGKRQLSLATIISPDGHILTKASQLRPGFAVEYKSEQYEASIVGIHKPMDLAMLKIDLDNLTALQLKREHENTGLKDGELNVGSWLVAPMPDSDSIVGVYAGKQKKVKPFLGVHLRDGQDGERPQVSINRVVKASPAERAGLRLGDRILKIDEIPIRTIAEFQKAVVSRNSHGPVKLDLIREGVRQSVQVELAHLVPSMTTRGQLPLMEGRRGYPDAFKHDAKLMQRHIGGPLIDLSGNVVGINISAIVRTPTSPTPDDSNSQLALALPIDRVIAVIEPLQNGELDPKIVNKSRIERLKKQSNDLKKLLSVENRAQVDKLKNRIREIEALGPELEELNRELAKLNQDVSRAERNYGKIEKQLRALELGINY